MPFPLSVWVTHILQGSAWMSAPPEVSWVSILSPTVPACFFLHSGLRTLHFNSSLLSVSHGTINPMRMRVLRIMTSLCANPHPKLCSVCACFMLFGGTRDRWVQKRDNTRATLTASEQCDRCLHTTSFTFHRCRVGLVFPTPVTGVRTKDKNKPKASRTASGGENGK